MTPYRPRELAGLVLEALGTLPVVVVTGLRQAGKSTFLRKEAGLSERHYVSLDEFGQLEVARRDPQAFVRHDGPLTIDEAHRCPELLMAIKREVDRDRRPGRFLLSGFANFALLKGITESLAGRAVYLTLWPFTRRETSGNLDTPPFLVRFFDSPRLPPAKGGAEPLTDHEVLLGGMPPVRLGEAPSPHLWFQGYEQTYLERDVRELTRVADLLPYRQVLRLAALRTGQVLKVSELARDAKLNTRTTSRYLAVMEASFIFHRLAPYLANPASRLIKSPKLYVGDSGLAAHLCGLSGPAARDAGALRGALFETYVAQNLTAMIAARWPEARIGYWHVQGRYEVDFVIEVGRESLAVEVKAAGRWSDRDLVGLRAFLGSTPRCRAAVLAFNGESGGRLGERLWVIPLATLLS